MTTEIAVLNKTGVALAADSAVTVAAGTQSQKTRNTANKVFALSKHAPVGIMIYGAAEVMGVPWETIIKMYRHSLGDKKFATLQPSCINYDVSGIVFRKVIKKQINKNSVSENCRSIIAPFAQSNDVTIFIEGMGPDIVRMIKQKLFELMTFNIPNTSTDELQQKFSFSKAESEKVKNMLEDIGTGGFEKVVRELDAYRRHRYVAPILNAIESLQKDELAFVAENFVNMVSFRKQVSHEAETVGGPIDVAVITKGDGLIWIKRKHYFDRSLNHHFFSKYFAGERNEK